jgi:hypothetical protein
MKDLRVGRGTPAHCFLPDEPSDQIPLPFIS